MRQIPDVSDAPSGTSKPKRDTRKEAAQTGKLLSHQEAGKLGGRGNKAADVIRAFKHGTQAKYILARLERDGKTELRGRKKVYNINNPKHKIGRVNRGVKSKTIEAWRRPQERCGEESS
jgi:hypothetical protein